MMKGDPMASGFPQESYQQKNSEGAGLTDMKGNKILRSLVTIYKDVSMVAAKCWLILLLPYFAALQKRMFPARYVLKAHQAV